MGLNLWKNYYAVFQDDDGSYVYRSRIKSDERAKKHFQRRGRTYIFKFERRFDYFQYHGFFSDNIYIFYNIHDPNPLKLRPFYNPIINAEVFNDILETDLIKQVNNVNSGWLKNLLTPRNIILALLLIGVLIYFTSGGKLW